MIWLALLGFCFTTAHAAFHIWHGRPWDVLWICTMSPALMGVGILIQRPVLVALGVLWLTLGVPLWILDLFTSREFHLTSTLTHIGGLTIGFLALRRMGFPSGVWWKAFLGLLAVQQLCRLVTPPEANVNLCACVPKGYESTFPSYFWYWLMMAGIFLATYLVLELILKRVFPSCP